MTNTEFEFRKEIEWFLSNDLRNVWLTFDKIEVYVRKGYRSTDDELRATFDIANIRVLDENDKGKGLFTEFLEIVEEKGFPIFVECIHNDRLLKFFINRGYKQIQENCAFKDGNDAPWLDA